MHITHELPLDQILLGDSIELMRMLPSGSIDCVFADPPEHVRRPDPRDARGGDLDPAAYDQFTHDWLKECRRLLRKDGTLWVIGSGRSIFQTGTLLQNLGFFVLNDVIWRKPVPPPNPDGRTFTNAHETLIWAARGRDARYKFNYQALAALSGDAEIRDDWLIAHCSGPEILRNQHGLALHPDQKPEALLHHVLTASTGYDDVVLDPFAGTGTTAVVARHLGRHFIAIERHPAYVEAAWARLRRLRSGTVVSVKPKAIKIDFGQLVASGAVPAGTRLFDRQRRVTAQVNADGTVSSGNATGSIHKVGAIVQNAPACDGWTFWYFERNGEMISLDTARASPRGS